MIHYIISSAKSFAYWLLTEGPIGALTGAILESRVYDRRGPVIVPIATKRALIAAIVYGVYEYPERVLIRRWLPRNMNCIELGCSIGIVSRLILRSLDPSCRLIAVEASKALFNLAQTNISAAGFSDRFIPIFGAISYEGDYVEFAEQAGHHTSGRIADNRSSEGVRTPTVQLRELKQVLNGPYSLVMDIEGSEFDLLEKDAESLSDCYAIIAELHGDKSSETAFVKALIERGFVLAEVKHSVYAFLRRADFRAS